MQARPGRQGNAGKEEEARLGKARQGKEGKGKARKSTALHTAAKQQLPPFLP